MPRWSISSTPPWITLSRALSRRSSIEGSPGEMAGHYAASPVAEERDRKMPR
jgi:hypothetical protein